MIQKLLNVVKDHCLESRLFYFAKPFLERGLYLFDAQDKCLKRLTLVSVKSFFGAHKKISKNKKSVGGGVIFLKSRTKRLLFVGETVYVLPDDKNIYKAFIKKGLLFESFNYPHTKLLNIDRKRKVFVMERATGHYYNDIFHNNLAINKMIGYSLTSPLIKSDRLYLQHGDSQPSNIVWSTNDEPIFIDLDGVEYLPILYDVIHYAATFLSAVDLVTILDSYKSELDDLFNRFDLNYSRETLDLVFCDYIQHFAKYDFTFVEDFIFLEELNNNEFRNTLMLLSKIKSK